MNINAKSNSGGFTLVEIMVAAVISFAVIAMGMQSFLHLYRASLMTSAYSQVHAEIRHSMDLINRDVMASSSVTVYSATNDLTLACELSSGQILVRYYVQDRKLYRSVDGTNALALGENISGLSFTMITASGSPTTVLADAFFIESVVDATIGVGKHTCNDVLKARTLMRNKAL